MLSYYYHGCESWDWYYPFHYAPFAADLVKCDKVKIEFELGEPLRPFEQLLSVFPKQSAHAVPECYRHLMKDADSTIIDFYPTEFRLDVNGAAFAWMGVNLLPFIDKDRLVKAMALADGNQTRLSESERFRNKPSGDICLFVPGEAATQKMHSKLRGLFSVAKTSETHALSFDESDLV